jgi:PPOX class probable F420-dependent enzyme
MASRYDLTDLPPEVLAFLTERHLAALTTLRPDGSPHVAPVGFTFDAASGLARVITFASAKKARNLLARPASRAALCQVDGRRWLTVEGPATLTADPARTAEAEARYAARYRPPKQRPDRVAIEIAVDRITGSA